MGGHTQPIKMPEGIRRDQFLAWVEALTDQNSPDWLGLPNNAEKVVFLAILIFNLISINMIQVLLASSAHDLVINLLKMQQLDEDEELAYRWLKLSSLLILDSLLTRIDVSLLRTAMRLPDKR